MAFLLLIEAMLRAEQEDPTMVKADTSRRRKEALAKCEEIVEQLKQENAELRKAAQAFGELAERLNNIRRLDAQQETPSRRTGRKNSNA